MNLEQSQITRDYKSIDADAGQRRNNLVFAGFPEERKENWKLKIMKFLQESMAVSEQISIQKAHRSGTYDKSRTRVITVYFCDYIDIETILSNAKLLRGTTYSIYRDFPREIVGTSHILWPRLKRLRKKYPDSKVMMAYPAKILVDSKVVYDCFPDWDEIMSRSRTPPSIVHKFSAKLPANLPLNQPSAQKGAPDVSVTQEKDASIQHINDSSSNVNIAPPSAQQSANVSSAGFPRIPNSNVNQIGPDQVKQS